MSEIISRIRPYQYLIVLAFLISFLKAIYQRKTSVFLFFITAVAVLEIIVFEIEYRAWNTNYISSNLVAYISIAFYYFVFSSAISTHGAKLRGYIELVILSSIVIYAVYDLRFTSDFLLRPYVIGLLVVSYNILLYLFQLFSDEDKVFRWRDPLIWLAFGILIFFMCSFPILLFGEVLIVDSNSLLFFHILETGNIFLALSYISASICLWKPSIITSI